jgi:hypothetical protein
MYSMYSARENENENERTQKKEKPLIKNKASYFRIISPNIKTKKKVRCSGVIVRLSVRLQAEDYYFCSCREADARITAARIRT